MFAGKKYAWMGAWLVLISALIGFYYAVVMGWVLRYVALALTNGLYTGVNTLALWNDFMRSPGELVFYQILSIALAAYVVLRGVRRGIELVNKVLIPSLFLLLLIAAVRALLLPDAIDGLKFLYVPRFHYLVRGETWVRALAQSAWSCSAGMGMAITYAVYMRKREDTALNSFITGLGNNSVSLIAGIAVICTVFGLSASSQEALVILGEESIALTFIHLTRLFTLMPGGIFVAALFFIGTAFAALTSMISGFEIAARNFMDYGWSREKSIAVIALATFILGLPSALIVTGAGGEFVRPLFLENQDFVWGLALILSGLFVAFAVWRYGVSKFRNDLINTGWNDIHIGRWWDYIFRYAFPIQVVVLLGWFFAQSFQGAWWDPLQPTTFATLLLQWVLIGAILIKLNKFFSTRF
jgi:NSS family neurotransmitter:Na+ symporter